MESWFTIYQSVTLSTLFLGFGWFIAEKNAVSHVIPVLMEQEQLGKNEIGMILTSQNVATAGSRFFGAILSDHMNPRVMFSSGLLLCGLANLLFAISGSNICFVAAMFLNGMTQGCGWPVCGKVLRRWVTPSQYGTAWSVLQSGANFAGILSPFLSAYLTMHHGWRLCMVVQGMSAVVFAIIATMTLIESPKKVGYKEPSLPGPTNGKQDQPASVHVTFFDLLRSPFILCVAFVMLVALATKTAVCDWGQLYLMHERGKSQLVVNAFKSSMEIGGLLGRMLVGVISDFVTKLNQGKAKRSRGNPRIPVAVVSLFAITVCLHWFQQMITEASSQWSITMLSACLGGFVYGMISLAGVIASESVPQHLNGRVLAIVALAGGVGGILGGLPCTFLAQRTSWRMVFVCVEVVVALTGILTFTKRNLTFDVGVKKKKE